MFLVFLISFVLMTITIIVVLIIPRNQFVSPATYILGYLQLLPIWCVIYLHKQPKQDENENNRVSTFIKKTEVPQPTSFLKTDPIATMELEEKSQKPDEEGMPSSDNSAFKTEISSNKD